MSTKITSYYLPNKAANSYIESKKTEEGTRLYDTALQDVGIETQAAIQSLNKSYSNVINDAYTNYLNSKRSIMSSNLGQGYKEAYLQNQQQAFQEASNQATLSAAETKQQILQQAYEQQNAIGEAFQSEVINMEKVGDYLSKYMEDLKNVTNESGSYYDAIISGKGLTDYKGEITAEDLYDELYNAQPEGYKYEDDKEALNWRDWLKTQIKTDKEQTWYDWYIGAGGYEQFQDAYEKGIYGGEASKYLADQEAEQKKLAEEQQKEYDEKVTRYKNRETANAELSKIQRQSYSKHDGWVRENTETVSKWLDTNAKNLEQYAKDLGLSEDEVKKALDNKNIRDYIENGSMAYWKTDRWGNKYELAYRGLPGDREKEYNRVADLLKEYAIKKSIGEV